MDNEHGLFIKIFEWLGGIAIGGMLMLWRQIASLRKDMDEYATKQEVRDGLARYTEWMVDKINSVDDKIDSVGNKVDMLIDLHIRRGKQDED